MIFKNVKLWILSIALTLAAYTSLRSETVFIMLDNAGNTVDVFGYYSYQSYFNSDCSRMVTVMCNKVVVWDTEAGKPHLIINDDVHVEDTEKAIFSPNGELILVVAWKLNTLETAIERSAAIYNAHTGQKVCEIKDFTSISMLFSPDSTKITGVDSNNNNVIWDVYTGNVLYVLDAQGGAVFSPNGKVILCENPSENCIKVFDMQTGELIQVLHSTACLGFSRDSSRILVIQNSNEASLADAVIVPLELDKTCSKRLFCNQYSLEPGYSFNPAKFAFGINSKEGYAVLRDKITGREIIMSLEPNIVPTYYLRTFDSVSIEAGLSINM